MPRVQFFIIGVQKSGTSWLARNLAEHPDIFMPRRELHFFDVASNYANGSQWYESHFESANSTDLVGEKTPEYLWVNGKGEDHCPNVHENIRAYNPDAQFIVCFRDPVDRAVSAANHLLKSHLISPAYSLDDLLVGKGREAVRKHGVLEKGLYYEQIAAYFDLFSKAQFLCLFYEDDLQQKPHETLSRVCTFLGVNNNYQFQNINKRINAFYRTRFSLFIAYYFPMPGIRLLARAIDKFVLSKLFAPEKISERCRLRLREFYWQSNEKLFDLLKKRPSGWKSAC